MTVNRSFVAAVALIAAIAMSAMGANAAPAARTASAFQLTLEETLSDATWMFEGTFTAGAPFCRSGTSVELPARDVWKRRLTCDDGSGSLVVSYAASSPDGSWLGPATSNWKILEGTGSYVGLRGKGSVRSEVLGGDPYEFATWRGTFQGIAAEDAIAPTIGFSSVEVTKFRRPAGAYSLALAIALRDEVEGAPVSYTLRVTPTTSPRGLAESVGTTAAGTASMTMRVDYYLPRVRAVVLRLSASDEVGNESSVSLVVRLPR